MCRLGSCFLSLVAGGCSIRRRIEVESTFLGEEAFIRRGLDSELKRMRSYRSSVDKLKVDAAQMLRENPWARDAIRAMVEERMKAMKTMAGSTSDAFPLTSQGVIRSERQEVGT